MLSDSLIPTDKLPLRPKRELLRGHEHKTDWWCIVVSQCSYGIPPTPRDRHVRCYVLLQPLPLIKAQASELEQVHNNELWLLVAFN